MESILLYVKVYLLRTLGEIASFLDRKYSVPAPPSHDFTVSIPSTVSKHKGTIRLYFYTPRGYHQAIQDGKREKYPFVVNFHGGGYTVGSAKNDARWAAFVTSKNAVLVSVEYRMGPECPFPTAVEDGADAILWLWDNATKHHLDATRTRTSGFSAGGTLSLAVPLLLGAEPKPVSGSGKGKIVGTISFYPGVDWTQTRAERSASNPICIEKNAVVEGMYPMFDRSYLGPEGTRPDMASPYLSPGRASDTLLREALPDQMVLYTCEWDQLLMEGEAFRKRLQALGKHVEGGIIPEEVHAFDKKPSFGRGNAKRDKMYAEAAEAIMGCGLSEIAN